MKSLLLFLCLLLPGSAAFQARAQVQAEAVVVVVSAKSDLRRLSYSEVADIFLGRVSRYPDGRPAVPLDHDEASTERRSFYALFTGHSAADVKAHWSRLVFIGKGQPPRVFADSVELLNHVAANPQAIAYLHPTAVDDRVRILMLD